MSIHNVLLDPLGVLLIRGYLPHSWMVEYANDPARPSSYRSTINVFDMITANEAPLCITLPDVNLTYGRFLDPKVQDHFVDQLPAKFFILFTQKSIPAMDQERLRSHLQDQMEHIEAMIRFAAMSGSEPRYWSNLCSKQDDPTQHFPHDMVPFFYFLVSGYVIDALARVPPMILDTNPEATEVTAPEESASQNSESVTTSEPVERSTVPTEDLESTSMNYAPVNNLTPSGDSFNMSGMTQTASTAKPSCTQRISSKSIKRAERRAKNAKPTVSYPTISTPQSTSVDVVDQMETIIDEERPTVSDISDDIPCSSATSSNVKVEESVLPLLPSEHPTTTSVIESDEESGMDDSQGLRKTSDARVVEVCDSPTTGPLATMKSITVTLPSASSTSNQQKKKKKDKKKSKPVARDTSKDDEELEEALRQRDQDLEQIQALKSSILINYDSYKKEMTARRERPFVFQREYLPSLQSQIVEFRKTLSHLNGFQLQVRASPTLMQRMAPYMRSKSLDDQLIYQGMDLLLRDLGRSDVALSDAIFLVLNPQKKDQKLLEKEYFDMIQNWGTEKSIDIAIHQLEEYKNPIDIEEQYLFWYKTHIVSQLSIRSIIPNDQLTHNDRKHLSEMNSFQLESYEASKTLQQENNWEHVDARKFLFSRKLKLSKLDLSEEERNLFIKFFDFLILENNSVLDLDSLFFSTCLKRVETQHSQFTINDEFGFFNMVFGYKKMA